MASTGFGGAGGGGQCSPGEYGGTPPLGNCGTPWPLNVAFGSPFQNRPSFSGTYCSSLSHISTVGARLPGLVSPGPLRTPRTLMSESCGIRQYNSPSVRSG